MKFHWVGASLILIRVWRILLLGHVLPFCCNRWTTNRPSIDYVSMTNIEYFEPKFMEKTPWVACVVWAEDTIDKNKQTFTTGVMWPHHWVWLLLVEVRFSLNILSCFRNCTYWTPVGPHIALLRSKWWRGYNLHFSLLSSIGNKAGPVQSYHKLSHKEKMTGLRLSSVK